MNRQWCLLFLFAVTCAASAEAAVPPPRRDLAEVRAVLARAPRVPVPSELRPLRVLLVANRKDHGPHEHDYPRWMERWKVLLGGAGSGKGTGTTPVTLYGPTSDLSRSPRPGAARVTVETARDWPTAEQLRRADLVVAFMGTGGIWNEVKLRDLKALLDRGAGFVALHAAVIAEKPHARPLAELLGLAWEGGTTFFRHGALDLKIAAPDHPITRGLPERIYFEDESYWPLVGDATRVNVLATAEETAPGTGRLQPQPMFWTHTVGKGRVFNSILGHYSWTFDDPYFRILVLRGMAWAAGESPYRFDPLVLSGARTTEKKPVATEEKPATAAPLAPDAADPNLLLWLDASDRVTMTTGPNGRVSAWKSKATRVRATLSTEGQHQPLAVPQALGGRPTVRFDGVDDVLREKAFRQAAGEWTVALVVTPQSNAGTFRALLAANQPGKDDFQTGFNIDFGAGGTGAFNTLNLEGIKGGGATNLRTDSAPFGSGHVLVLSTGSGGSRLWVNGHQEEGRGASDAVTVMEELRLGGRFYFGRETGYFHGDVSEVLIYRTQLTDAQRSGLTAHLMQKYGPDIRPPAVVSLDPWDYLPTYDWGSTRRPLAPIDEAIARVQKDSRTRKALEARLLEVLADPANTAASRDFACRRLAIIGSPASVPVLAALLGDPTLATMACFALERIPGDKAERVLVEALPRMPARHRIEVIQVLANRRSRRAVPHLARVLQHPDAGVRGAAVAALGNIGGTAALTALTTAFEQGASADRTVLAGALLLCAERSQAEGRQAEADALYERLRKADLPPHLRRSAARALILLRGAEAAPLLVEQLRSGDEPTRTAALLLVREAGGSSGTRGGWIVPAVASALAGLPPEVQVPTLGALADRGDPDAAPAVRTALRSSVPEVRLAALRALGRLGDVSDIPVLLATAAADIRDQTAAARASLAALSGNGVDAALLRALEQGELAVRAAAIEALGRRGHAPAARVLVRIARGTEPALRQAAIPALGETATAAEIPALVEILSQSRDPGEMQAVEKTLTTVYQRTSDKEQWVEALLTRLGETSGEAKLALLRTLSLHGGPKALQALRIALRDTDTDVQEEALDLLAGWETPDAAADLLEVVRTSTNRVHRTLALRAYIRMAGMTTLTPAQRLAMGREGLRQAQRDDERRLALATLAGIPTADALQTVLPFIEQEGLSEEAGAAAVAIAQKLLPGQPAAVREAMDRVRRHLKNVELLRQAAELHTRAEQAGR